VLFKDSASQSPSKAQASTTLPPLLPDGRQRRVGTRDTSPVSSWNSRAAAARPPPPASYSPFGIDHAPASFFIQNGPPGCLK
jgi:hypothetical protein